MKGKKLIKLSLFLAVLSLMMITISVTYTLFTYTKTGETENTITTGGITFHYKEINGKGNGISITDATPVANNENAKGSNDYFEFRITSTVTDGIEIPYVVTARMDPNSDSILGDIINIYLTEAGTETPTALFSGDLVKYNSLEQYDQVSGYTEKIIYTDTVREASYNKTFRLRMWIDANTNFNTGNGTSDYNNKSFSITVNVNALGSLANNNNGGGNNAEDDENIPPVSKSRAGLYAYPTTDDAEPVLTWQELLDQGYLAVDENGVLSYGTTSMASKRGLLVIEEGVTRIGSIAARKLDAIEMPDTVTSISDSAFRMYQNLVSIRLSKNLTEIGPGAFYYATKLQSLYIPSGVTVIPDSMCGYCSSLTEVNIPPRTVSIGDNALYATKLTSVTLPDTVRILYNGAFNDVPTLTEVTLNQGLETIKNYAFYNSGIETIVIPDSVTVIEDTVFAKNKNLKYVTLSKNLTEIADYTFDGCTSLETIEIPTGVTRIGMQAFLNDTALTNVILPETIQEMDFEAFKGCTSLGNTIEGNLAYIGNTTNPHMVLVRTNDNTISSASIDANTKYISYAAFQNCPNLTSITIPDGVRSIDSYAFYPSGLTNVTIPSSVDKIGYMALETNTLQSVTFNDTNNWKYKDSPRSTNGTALDVTNPTTNATNLNTNYSKKYWYKSTD